MSDPNDVKLLESGELDLQRCDFSNYKCNVPKFSGADFKSAIFKNADFSDGDYINCDFRGAKISSTNFSNSNFINCLFSQVIFSSAFENSIFNKCTFETLVSRSNFKSVKFIQSNVKKIRFDEENNLDGAIADNDTNFVGVTMPRSLSRLPIFINYTFEKGVLAYKKSSDKDQEGPKDDELNSEEEPPEVNKSLELNIETSLRYNRAGVKVLCLSLSDAIIKFIDETPRPNDPEKLDFHERYISFLEKIMQDAINISVVSNELEKKISAPDMESAKRSVLGLHNNIKDWWANNEMDTINYGANIGILGMGTALLIFCGAPATMATTISVALGGSKKVLDFLKRMKD